MKKNYILPRPTEGQYTYYQAFKRSGPVKPRVITVLDCVDGKFIKQHSQPYYPVRSAFTDLPYQFSDLATVLRSRPANARTRIVWIEYVPPLDLDLLKTVGANYNIDPKFFGGQIPGRETEQLSTSPLPPALPSQHQFFRLEFGDAALTAVFYKDAPEGEGAERTAGGCHLLKCTDFDKLRRESCGSIKL
jgi:hypothetical protein